MRRRGGDRNLIFSFEEKGARKKWGERKRKTAG